MVLVVVIAVLSGAAISLLSMGGAQHAAEEAARRLVADLEFAQVDAIANRSPRLVAFDIAAESYSVRSQSGAITHPVTKKPYEVDLGELYRGAAVDLRKTGFSGVDTLRIASDGSPQKSGSLFIGAAGIWWRIDVVEESGRITLSPWNAAPPGEIIVG